MSKEERAEFKKCCVIAIDYLWQFIKPYNEIVWKTVTIPSQPEPIKVQSSRLSELESLLKDEEDPYIYRNLMQAITCNELRLQHNSLYSYDYTYFTSETHNAASYAATSWKFGEIGQIAYRFYQAIQKLQPSGWHPSDVVIDAIEKLVSFVNEKEQPVVVEFFDYEMQYLFTDRGKPVSEDDMFKGRLMGHFYYTQEVNLNIERAIPLDEFVKIKGLK